MGIGEFPIKTYGIMQGYSNRGQFEGPQASLTLYGPLEGGVQKSATLSFDTRTHLSGTVSRPERVTAHLPYDAFRPMYDLLRHEAPVKAYYRYDAEFADLYFFGLYTDETEPPGEGPADANVVRSLMRSMRKRLPRRSWAGSARPGGRLPPPTLEDHPPPDPPDATRT